jgi:UDP-N-acetylmuramoyl-tripeptide--D-alanyl-D-alanine ligase
MSDAPLWRFSDFVAAMDAHVIGSAPAQVTGISIDSRTLAPGEAFFAIRGERFDGHDFVGAALDAGASAAVVADAMRDRLDRNGTLCFVRDPLEALVALARAARARSRAQVIAVTGSVGKTGTKEALRLALSHRGEVHASAASHNNHWGVPLSLARLPAETPYAVFEIGMNHAGEITPLTRLVRPHVAVITTVEPVHLEFFDSVEAIAEAKAEIFLGLGLGGTAVLNRDNVHFDLLARRAREAGGRIVSFGADEAADVRLVDLTLDPEGSAVRARVHGRDVSYRLGAPGRHLALNSLAVLAAAEAAGADPAVAALALGDLKPPKGRGARSVIELPGGVVTPGRYDLRPTLERIPFPASLAGKRCLDVGSRDGFWAFAMEERGGGCVRVRTLAGRQLAVDRRADHWMGERQPIGAGQDLRLHETLGRRDRSGHVELRQSRRQRQRAIVAEHRAGPRQLERVLPHGRQPEHDPARNGVRRDLAGIQIDQAARLSTDRRNQLADEERVASGRLPCGANELLVVGGRYLGSCQQVSHGAGRQLARTD